ncbi:hypothetical protein D9613_006291 [Agrocybe pediades]|uniref:GST N-terminal domain-containing protein n=1 Tax=Agrocybe pediades TaxID=84607 RepID=A0A8H4QVB2_9AGAR|nr:hypothetical protein D9613_006291 [Agrocybe pediades]
MTIILYDTPCQGEITTWSPYVWKARHCLNFKGIPYKTEWVEFADIESHFKKLGINPTGKNRWDGGDFYTVPAIHDTETGAYISDSWLIAEYLEKQYPDTPTLFPGNTKGLQAAFTAAHLTTILPMRPYIVPRTPARLSERSGQYFRRTREAEFGKKLEDVIPQGDQAKEDWKKFEDSFNMLNTWFKATDEKGLFMLGETSSWADLNMASFLKWMRFNFGEDSEEWKRILSWNEGRWDNLVKAFDKYSAIV